MMLLHALMLLAFALVSDSTALRARPSVPAPTPKTTLAVLYFDNNTGSKDYDALGKGMASMMITDLAGVQQLQVVEREHMQEILAEMDRQHTKYFDSTTAVKAGKLVGAEYVVAGSVAALQPQIRLDTRVIRVQTGEVVRAEKVIGQEDKFFELQQKLSKQLIDGLSLSLTPAEKQTFEKRQETNRIDRLSTMVGYSQSVALFDVGDYGGALEKMVPVVRAAPGSMMVTMTYDEIKKRAANKTKDRVKEGLRGLIKRPD
jgi:TolB-like protein